jgi:hypothetical protein
MVLPVTLSCYPLPLAVPRFAPISSSSLARMRLKRKPLVQVRNSSDALESFKFDVFEVGLNSLRFEEVNAIEGWY